MSVYFKHIYVRIYTVVYTEGRYGNCNLNTIYKLPTYLAAEILLQFYLKLKSTPFYCIMNNITIVFVDIL